MPDVAQVLALLAVGGAVALIVASPFRRPPRPARDASDSSEQVALRRELALEALRDLEADRAAGSLDDAQYLAQREEAEARAAAALAALDAEGAATTAATPGDERLAGTTPNADTRTDGAKVALLLGSLLGAVLLVGFVAPGAPLANPTRVNEQLAAAMSAERERRAEIERLRDRLAADPRDRQALSALADAYLAGSSEDDLAQGATALLALLRLEPENRSAFTRLITAYIRAGDYDNAAAATEAFAEVAPGSADLAFFEGVIALRRDGDADAATAAFDRFLELAPDDPRAGMVRTLRAEAAGDLAEPAP